MKQERHKPKERSAPRLFVLSTDPSFWTPTQRARYTEREQEGVAHVQSPVYARVYAKKDRDRGRGGEQVRKTQREERKKWR